MDKDGHPSGILTFLFTDIQGSTPLWEKDPAGMGEALELHNAALSGALEAHGGRVFKVIGDEFQVVFEDALQAVKAAVAGQRALLTVEWGRVGPLSVRMGVHTGPAVWEGTDYAVTHTFNRAARIMSCGHGGQILLSVEVVDQIDGHLPPEITLQDLGRQRMKGMTLREHLFQVVSQDLRNDFPPLKTERTQQEEDIPEVANNLPTPATPFVGRTRELVEIGKLIGDPDTRLLTILGPGGMGKTRLALQAARLHGRSFNDGNYWVTFSHQDETELVFDTAGEYIISTMNTSLGLTGEDPKSTLKAYLKPRRILIILDGFEHLIAGASTIFELLMIAPACKFLVTSRERLNIPGEVLFTISGLAFATANQNVPCAMDAVDLFLQAANRVSNMEYSEPLVLSTIERICSRLKGIPLAIELAADWTRLLPVSEVEQELDRGLEILGSGSTSMRAAIDRSWNLLTSEQRTAFAQLSVFQRSFSRDAAQKIAGTNLGTLLALFDKSMVQRSGEDRYAIHDLLRQYAREQLLARGEEETVRDNHCRYFAALADKELKSIGRGDHKTIEADLDNLRAAWRWAIQRRRLDDLRKMIFPMGFYYNMRAKYVESEAQHRMAVEALRMAEPEGLQGLVYGKALTHYGISQTRVHGHDYAVPTIREGLTILRRLGARRELAWPLMLTGGGFHDAEQKEQCYLEAVEIAEEFGDPYEIAFALLMLGSNYRLRGKYDEAQAVVERGLAISHADKNKQGMATALRVLGRINLHRGEYEEARSNFEEECILWRALTLPRLAGEARLSQGIAYLGEGDYRQAKVVLQESLAEFEQIGDEGSAVLCLLNLAQAALQQGAFKEARHWLEAARPLMEHLTDYEDQARWWHLSARISLEEDDLVAAQSALGSALENSLQVGGFIFVEIVVEYISLYQRTSREEDAARLLGYAEAQNGLPAALIHGRIEALRTILASKLGDTTLSLLEAEGAAYSSNEIREVLEADSCA